jgi:hypothetical protein
VESNDEISTAGHMIDLHAKIPRKIYGETKQISGARSNRVGIDTLQHDDIVFDMPTEKKVEVAMKYLLEAWEHHKVKAGECQAHINTLVELREMHETRLRSIRQKLDKLLYYDKYN